MSLTTKRIGRYRIALFRGDQRVGEIVRYTAQNGGLSSPCKYGLSLTGVYWSPSNGSPNDHGGFTTKCFVLQRDAIAAANAALTELGR